MNNLQEFAGYQVDWRGEDWRGEGDENLEVEGIEQLRYNKLTRGLVTLENIFYRHDMYKQKKEVNKPEDSIEINIGSEASPKLIRIGKTTSAEERRQIEDLIREYRDVFAWSYDDLKAYKGNIIQHTIPLKEGAKPFRQKLRRINPKLAPLIQK